MMRSLFSGVSGLRNHQARMDVIGNNIANVNTVGFKSSRVTFAEAFAQLLQGASRPPGDLGGINPIQIGLGSKIGSIDMNFSQGNLESTGQATDLAIQGDGFFMVSDGARTFYTRAGNFQLDANGRMVSPANGFTVQGINADSAGELSTGTTVTDVTLPFGQKSPARATSELTLAGNLDSREQPLATILTTDGKVYAIEQSGSNGGAGSDVSGLYANGAANAQILGMVPNGTTVTVTVDAVTKTYTYVAADTGTGNLDFHSILDLRNEMANDFGASFASIALNDTTGAIDFTTAGTARTLSIASSNPALVKALGAASGTIAAATTSSTDQFSHVAQQTDLVTNLRDGQGQSLGLASGDAISLAANKGETALAVGNPVLTVGAGTDFGQFVAAIHSGLAITNIDGVAISDTTGALTITGDGGTANGITGLNIQSSGAGAAAFNAIFGSQPGNWVENQAAEDVSHDVAMTVYDSIGNPVDLSLKFTKDPTAQNRWLWSATVPEPANITGGGSGAATFDSNGRLESFSYDGGSSSLQLDPGTGAESPVDINLDPGVSGESNGLSQFAAASNAVASSQDGYPMGNLQDISVDSRGVITGYFSNGINQTLAQIALATFTNPTGLLRQGNNMFAESGNSGSPIVGYAGTSNQSSITPGALEGSNVDLSEEFTNMIIAQRGFQANARIITTADEMLSEVVQLRR
jgi:flagellar hook protein FlgE